MPVSVSSLKVSDVVDALTGAREATYLWSPDDDTLDWAAAPANLLDAPSISAPSSGATWRALLSAGDIEARDAWIADPKDELAFTGTLSLIHI